MPKLSKTMGLGNQEVMMFEPLLSHYLPSRIDVASRLLQWWESYKSILSRYEQYADIADKNVEDALTIIIPILIKKYPERCERKQISLDRLESALVYGIQKTAGSYADLRDDLIERETPMLLAVAITWSWYDMKDEGVARAKAEESERKMREAKQDLYDNTRVEIRRTNEYITRLQADITRFEARNDEIRQLFADKEWKLDDSEKRLEPARSRGRFGKELKF